MIQQIAAIYVRVSTTKDSQKDSPEHQKGLCEEKARALQLNVYDHVYEDRDTGTSIVAREMIQRLIKDAQNKFFDTIIFASLSRFSRDTLDALNLKRILVDALGVRLISIEEGFDSFKDNDELKFQIISAVNQKLSEQISLSSKRGIRQSALKGNFTGSITPYGYKKVVLGERKTLVPEEETSRTIKLIFDLYTSRNMGEKAIVHYLNEEKEIPSPKGGAWGITTIQRILTNEVYIGENVFGKYEIKKVYNDINNMADRSKKQVQRDKARWERSQSRTHPAIIDDETFILAQEIRFKRGGGRRGGVRNKVNVFAGMIFCKHCGASMVSSKSKGGKYAQEGREYRYLVCSARRRQGDRGCSNNMWFPYQDFREQVIGAVREKLSRLIDVDAITESYKGKIVKPKGPILQNDIKKFDKIIESNRKLLFEIRKQKMLGELDEAQYQFEKEQYEKEIALYQERISQTTEQHEDEANLEKLHEDIRRALEELAGLKYEELDEMRLVLGKLVHRLVVGKDGEVEVYTPLGPMNS
ncbi:recombinase family protein [Paenibacillus sp. TRM 82003]|nr:recombinase family protein [Paenibacillus sp. TRM 82003]